MSYARLSDDSDVYVYAFNAAKHRDAFHCQGCILAPDGNFYAYSYADIRKHLREHLGAGHKVTSKAFQHLLEDEMDDWELRARIIAVMVAVLAAVLAWIYILWRR